MGTSENGLSNLQISATVAAIGGLSLCAFLLLGKILPGILWAFVLSIALWPTFLRVRGWRTSRGWQRLGAPLIFTALICFLVALPVALGTLEIIREAQSLAVWINDARHNGVVMPETIDNIPWIGGRVASWWRDNLSTPTEAANFFRQVGPGSILGLTRNLGPEILHRTLLFAITLITVFFLFQDGEGLWLGFTELGQRVFGARSVAIASHVIDAIHGTVDGLVLVGLVEGLVISIGYWLTGVPHGMAFAIATCILATIPFGAPLVFCVAALLVLANGSALWAIGLVIFGFLVVFATDHVIRPMVIGGATQIPFLLVLLGILGGLSSLGLVGLFVGPALMAIIVAVWRDLSADTNTSESDEPRITQQL